MRVTVLILTLCASMAGAQNPALDCWCRGAGGERFELGDVTCLTISGRSFLAQCQMSLNTPMWRELSEGCLSS